MPKTSANWGSCIPPCLLILRWIIIGFARIYNTHMCAHIYIYIVWFSWWSWRAWSSQSLKKHCYHHHLHHPHRHHHHSHHHSSHHPHHHGLLALLVGGFLSLQEVANQRRRTLFHFSCNLSAIQWSIPEFKNSLLLLGVGTTDGFWFSAFRFSSLVTWDDDPNISQVTDVLGWIEIMA